MVCPTFSDVIRDDEDEEDFPRYYFLVQNNILALYSISQFTIETKGSFKRSTN